jgi:hypothetical protein
VLIDETSATTNYQPVQTAPRLNSTAPFLRTNTRQLMSKRWRVELLGWKHNSVLHSLPNHGITFPQTVCRPMTAEVQRQSQRGQQIRMLQLHPWPALLLIWPTVLGYYLSMQGEEILNTLGCHLECPWQG